jgi:hypothetical protein
MAKKKAATKKAAKTTRSTPANKRPAVKTAAPRRPPQSIIGRKYKKNFLKQVIARIDFAAPVPALREGPATVFPHVGIRISPNFRAVGHPFR